MKECRITCGTLLFTCLVLLLWPMQNLGAQETPTTPTKSGYPAASALESPDGVVAELAQDDVDAGAVFRPPLLDGLFQPWFDLKREWNRKYGLQLGFNYNALYQVASETATTEDDAGGGRFQAQGMWTVLGRKSQNPGGISFRVEDRHRLGTEIPPSKLGSQFGSATVTGTGFSDFEFAVTEVAWRQTALDGDMKFGFGKISGASWYNAHALSGALTGYQNSAMRTSGAKPSVGRGLGAVGAIHLGEPFALLAGIHDANAVTWESPFDTIDETEFYYSAELRWFPTSFDRRKWDQVRLQGWYVDETDQGATPSGYGASFAASRLFNDRYMPFVLGGISDGESTLIEKDLTAGVAFAFNTVHRAARDILGLGINWTDPSDGSLDEQFSSEFFYRFQLFQNIAFTPSVQYIDSPSFDPQQSSVWVGGIRGRMTF